jgi:hypothetical protein
MTLGMLKFMLKILNREREEKVLHKIIDIDRKGDQRKVFSFKSNFPKLIY